MMIPSLTGAQTPEPSPYPAAMEGDSIHQEIVAVLDAQAAAWNAGDIDGYLRHYWQSDRLSFCSGGKRTFGWSAVLARYKQRYATREAMGRLAFSDVEVRTLSPTLALVIGDWQLQRASDNPGGNFSLVLEKIDDRWVIVHDHTSSRTPTNANLPEAPERQD